MPGVFTLIEGDDEAATYLYEGDEHVEAMLTDLVGDITDHAAEELRTLAPGTIGAELIGTDEPHLPDQGAIVGVAGVLPDISEEMNLGAIRGLGSDPADYPVFVELGTGIFGEYERPIQVMPGHVMVIPFPDGKVFTRSIAGQPGQHYAERAYENTIQWIPGRLTTRHLPSGGT